MMKHIMYRDVKVYNSKQVRAFLNIEFDLLLHLFYENKKLFKDGADYFYVDREKFASFTGQEIKGISPMIYLWTSSGVDILRELLDSERQLTIWDMPEPEKVQESMSQLKKVAKAQDIDVFVPPEGLDVGDVARALQTKGLLSFGQNTLFRKLRNRGVLNAYNVPYQQYIKNGMFGIFVQEKRNGRGEYLKCKVFEKGVNKIVEWFGDSNDYYGD